MVKGQDTSPCKIGDTFFNCQIDGHYCAGTVYTFFDSGRNRQQASIKILMNAEQGDPGLRYPGSLNTPKSMLWVDSKVVFNWLPLDHWERFANSQLPFSRVWIWLYLGFFNRTKDWTDLQAMQEAGTPDREAEAKIPAEFIRADDKRLEKLFRIAK